MDAMLSQRSTMSRFDAAAALAMWIREVGDDIVVITFGNTSQEVAPRRGFALAEAMRNAHVGHATMGELAKQHADKLGYDRIIMISDMQLHDHLTAPKGTGYMVNVAGYQNAVGYGAWTHIDGWSEGVLKYIQALEA